MLSKANGRTLNLLGFLVLVLLIRLNLLLTSLVVGEQGMFPNDMTGFPKELRDSVPESGIVRQSVSVTGRRPHKIEHLSFH